MCIYPYFWIKKPFLFTVFFADIYENIVNTENKNFTKFTNFTIF